MAICITELKNNNGNVTNANCGDKKRKYFILYNTKNS